MSPDNMFRTKPTTGYKVSSINFFRQRSKQSPFTNPQLPGKKKKRPPNGLIDPALNDGLSNKSKFSLLDRIINFVLRIIGKEKEWQNTKTKLNMLQNRINSFETAINSAKNPVTLNAKFKHYRV